MRIIHYYIILSVMKCNLMIIKVLFPKYWKKLTILRHKLSFYGKMKQTSFKYKNSFGFIKPPSDPAQLPFHTLDDLPKCQQTFDCTQGDSQKELLKKSGVTLKVGETAKITLDENSSKGYVWECN